jgi:hypothetical protein
MLHDASEWVPTHFKNEMLWTEKSHLGWKWIANTCRGIYIFYKEDKEVRSIHLLKSRNSLEVGFHHVSHVIPSETSGNLRLWAL